MSGANAWPNKSSGSLPKNATHSIDRGRVKAPGRENRRFFGTGGRSKENAGLGFSPAVCDRDSGAVYRSRFADGRPAPFHLQDGLPDEVVLRANAGRITGTRASLVAGFVLGGRFFTREEAAASVSSSFADVPAHH
jgi:hypothetical protein